MSDSLPPGCIPIDQPLRKMQRKWLRELYGPWDAESARLLTRVFLPEYLQRERRDLLRAITTPPQAYGWTQRRDEGLAKALNVSERTVRRDLKRIDKEE